MTGSRAGNANAPTAAGDFHDANREIGVPRCLPNSSCRVSMVFCSLGLRVLHEVRIQ
jgi:hypothetical protein